jgi:RNA polymerase sigma factor (sigma-70 family)
MSQPLSLPDPSGRLLAAAGGDPACPLAAARRAEDFARVWQHAQATLRAYLASFVPDGGLLDDCLQEVALVAWRKGPLDQGDAAFLHHALACARHIGMAARRKRLTDRLKLLSPEVAQSLADAVALAAETAPDPGERVEALRRCIGRLQPDQQALIRLRYGEDSAVALAREAKRCGKSAETLYKRLERLRATLRDCVNRQLSPPA